MTDLLSALRSLRRAPGHALASLLTLGLGIGAVTAIFSVVNGVLLKPLPFRSPDRLFVMSEKSASVSARLPSYLTFLDYRAAAQSFEGLGYILGEAGGIRTAEGIVQYINARVSDGFFNVIGATPLLGRVLGPEDERPGAEPAAVLTYAFWRQQFGGDPSVLGRTLDTGEGSFTVVGVLPAGAVYPGWAQVYTALAAGPALPAMSRRDVHVDGGMIARLRAGVDSTAAAGELARLSRRFAEAYPAENAGFSSFLTPMSTAITGSGTSTPLLLLLAATVLLLVMACVNVTSLGLARVAERTREMALRTALGAGRLRLVRQLILEMLVLSLLGAGLGLLLAAWLVHLLAASGASNLVAAGVAGVVPRLEELALDARVFAMALGLTLVAGFGAGLLPAIAGSRPDLAGMLKQSASKGGTGRASALVRRWMIGLQAGLALALLVSAALLVNSFYQAIRADRGFQGDGVLTVHVFPGGRYASPSSDVAGLYRRLAERVSGLPGVESVGLINHLPMAGSWNGSRIGIDGNKPAEGEELTVGLRVANQPYLESMGIPMIRGRWFTEADMSGTAGPVVINRALAERYWPGKDPLGHQVSFFKSAAGRSDFGQPIEGTVVGVVSDVRQFGLDQPSDPAIYLPYTVNPWGHIFLTVRTAVDPETLLEPVRRALLSEESELVLTGVQPMNQVVSSSLAPREFLTLLVAVFAAAALGLATIGLYGVLSRLVRAREREIGIRRAVGADRGAILALVLKEGMVSVGVGALAGVVAALLMGRLFANLLFGVTAADLLTYLVALGLLHGVAFLACYLPARRAADIDPTVALSGE
jgi:predicted permease